MSTETGTAYDPTLEEARLAALTARLVEEATRGGADEAEACGAKSEVIQVGFEKGDLQLTQVDEATGLGLRVLRARRQGFASTNQTHAGALQALAADASTLASFSPPDEHNGLPAAAALDPSLELCDPAILAFPVEVAVEAARDMVARTLARDPRLSLDKASLSVTRTSVALASSTGVAAVESDATVSMSLFGMALDGDDVGGFDYWGESVRTPGAIEGAIATSIEHFADAALANLGAGAAASYKGPVLFSPAAFFSIFVAPLCGAASAIAVQRGRSALAGKVGEPVAAPCLTLVDDPRNRLLAGACTFDREGQPARRFPIVEEGVLRGYLYNSYAAAVDGAASTGHASGGTTSVPGLAPHALSVAPGAGGDVAALRRALGRGLLVQRFSGTVDPASGDFSGVAKSARWVERGEVVRSVKETLISGNAFELLRGALTLGSAAESLMGSALGPWALVDGVSVTAG
jgi:PmbA protein